MTKMQELIKEIENKIKEIESWKKIRDMKLKQYERELLKLGERYLKLKEKEEQNG